MTDPQNPMQELLNALAQPLRWAFGEGGKRGRLIAVVVLVAVGVWTSVYQVEPEEVAVVTRFGRFLRITKPGLHLKWPFGIERVRKAPIQRQLKQEFGFRTVSPAVRTAYERPAEAVSEAMMLTGDLNVATVEWIVQYKIRDPYQYLFRVRNVADTFRDMSEAAMRQVVGDRSVTEVITVGREDIQRQVKNRLQKLCDRYEIGIEVLQLVLQDVNPPEPVRASFNEVNQAMQEKERAINQAWANYNRTIPEAKGRALQQIQSAEGYAAERLNRAKGEAERFIAMQGEYTKAKQVTRDRLYLETMLEVLPKAQHWVVLDSHFKNLLPFLKLNQGTSP